MSSIFCFDAIYTLNHVLILVSTTLFVKVVLSEVKSPGREDRRLLGEFMFLSDIPTPDTVQTQTKKIQSFTPCHVRQGAVQHINCWK